MSVGTGRGWWRTNRVWLPLLAVAVVAAVVASSYRVGFFWYDAGLHHRVAAAEPGAYVAVRDTTGGDTRSFRVRLSEVRRVSEVPGPDGADTAPPSGVAAYRMTLDFAASAGQDLSGCSLALVDADGHRYDVESGGAVEPKGLCLPTGATRPGTWSVRRVVLVREGERVAGARLWFGLPDYVSLPAPGRG